MYDILIIGGGPAGVRAAELAAAAGLKTALFEQRAVGGVCLNEGCIPSKALLYTAKLYDAAKGGAAPYGVTCQNPVLDYVSAVKRKDKVVKKLAAGIEAALKRSGAVLIREKAVITGRMANGFAVTAGGEPYIGKYLLVCTGSGPVLPPIKNAEAALTNRGILSLTDIPKTLAVIGGGAIGLEMASLFHSIGSAVTVYEAADRIVGPFDREISELLQKVYTQKGVTFHLNTAVSDIAGLGAEMTLISAGRRPAVTGIGLDSIGVLTERNAITTDDRMQTNIQGVYAAGDCNGKSMLAHTAYREAEVAVNNILGRGDRMTYNAIPAVIYTNPEAAGVGETLESAMAKGCQNARETKLPMMYCGRFMAENERGTGICKLVWDGELLIGAHILGNPASEIIAALAPILHQKMSAEEIKKLVLPHPTAAEIIKEAAFFGA